MNKTEMMWIRICKSNHTQRRLKRYYKMAYYRGEYDASAVASFLLQICDKYKLISLRGLAEDLNPRNHWKFVPEGEVYSHDELIICVLVSAIRLTMIDKLPGYIKPPRFRVKEEKKPEEECFINQGGWALQ